MPYRALNRKASQLIWLGLPLIIVTSLALIGVEIYLAVGKTPEVVGDHELVVHTFEVINTARLLESSVKNAETGQRGFLITGNPRYLDAYSMGVHAAPDLLARLKQLTVDSPDQQHRLLILEHQINIKLSELKQTVKLRKSKGFELARQIVETDVGFNAMNTISGLIDETITAEDELLEKRLTNTTENEHAVANIAIIGGALAFVVMLLGSFLVLFAFRNLRRAEANLVETQTELAHAQKLDALGQLSGGVAHDFNNFVHVIMNAAEILERRLENTNEVDLKKYIDVVKRNADRASNLTQRLLAFSRRQPLEPKPVDSNKLIMNIADLLRQTLGEGIEIETVLGGGIWRCSADVSQLEAALLNLAINARDAMPSGGKLTIETSNAFLDEVYAAAHGEVKPGQYVMIAISDTGTGMTKETIAKAFDPFFTTKEVGKGTGLGLSQVYGYIKQSNGHVKIYSELGEGTSIKLYLPRLMTKEATEIPMAERPDLSGAATETILVVEDNEDVQAFTAEILGELGYRVLVASNAHSALRVLEQDPKVNLLFTDVGLPDGINGRQLADEARRRWPQLRVLFMTAYARNAIIHHGRLDAGVDLIVKPFTQDSLAQKVKEVLN